MPNYTYNRSAVPVGQTIKLEVTFRDVAGNVKDTDTSYPTISILDAVGAEVLAATDLGVVRTGVGSYRYSLLVPDGYETGVWNDVWVGSVDGYSVTAGFDFTVNSQGSIEAVGATAPVLEVLGDEPVDSWSQAEIKGLNVLLKLLRRRLSNTSFKPDGTSCDVFSVQELVSFLITSLSEFNSTPTITNYTFDNEIIYKLFCDAVTQGAYLYALASHATLEAARQFTVQDNGVTISPPDVAGNIMALISAQLSDYRAKLKEIKRNHRPIAAAYVSGGLLQSSAAIRRYRMLKERQIL